MSNNHWAAAPGAAELVRPLSGKKRIVISIVVVLLSVGAGFGGWWAWRTYQSVGKKEITALHDKMAKREFAAIYDSTEVGFRAMYSRQRADSLFGGIADRLGAPVGYRVENFQANTNNGLVTETLELKTKFVHGEGEEYLTLELHDGEWQLSEYRCESEKLKGMTLAPNPWSKSQEPDKYQ